MKPTTTQQQIYFRLLGSACKENMNAEDILHDSIAASNVSKNVNGGYYRNGATKPLVEKLDVATKWIEMMNDSDNPEECPSINALAKARAPSWLADFIGEHLQPSTIL